MCGILGIISKNSFKLEEGLRRLKRLEYRGYDSVGFLTNNGIIIKKVGDIDNIIKYIDKEDLKKEINIFIGHTRWATHGKVNDINAHPHFDCRKEIYVIHNGTIENYKELKDYLIRRGHIFISETDSEIFAHWIEDGLSNGKNIKDIVKEIFEKFKGTYAVLVYIKNKNKLLVIKNKSALVLGLKDDKIYIASDVYAFLDDTQDVIVLDDYEWLEIDIK